MSLTSRTAKVVAKKVAKKATAPDKMGKVDTFLASVGDPNNVTDAQLRKLERMIPGLGAVERKRATEFLGLSPDARFPNRRILERAGLMEPIPAGKFPETPLGHFPQPRPSSPDMDVLGNQVMPQRRVDAMDAFASQSAPAPKMSRTGNVFGALARHPVRTGLGLGAAGLGGLSMLASHDTDAPEDPPPTQDYGLYEDTKFDPTKIAPSQAPMRRAIQRRPSAPKPSGLTGVNGAGDMSDLSPIDFGQETPDYVSQYAPPPSVTPDVPQQKKGGGFGDILKTIGPLIAALLAGRMMK